MLVMTLLMMMRVSWWCWWWRCWWWWELADDVGDLVPHFLRWSIPVLVPDRARILGLEMSWQVLSKLTCLDRILDMLKIDRNRQVVIVDGQVRQLCVEDLAMLIESTNESLLLFVDWAAPVNLLRVLYAMHYRSNACRRTWELATLNICWWPAALRQSLADWSHAHACRPTTFDGSIGCPWASTPWPSTSCRRGREVLPKLLRLYLLTKGELLKVKLVYTRTRLLIFDTKEFSSQFPTRVHKFILINAFGKYLFILIFAWIF